ncbi:MAG TPA: phenylalanine--tRNA ligase subunit alpha [Candidatus Nanoarchaeia archaeon]|nr:phenylalanine--tRNA ligase subunit alpha [Candidatus Nanoarchaeia archaeon]
MEKKKIIEQLHPLERKVLPLLDKFTFLEELISHSGLKDVEVMRALQWLENKKIIQLRENPKNMVSLDKNGLEYLKKGLPEKRFLDVLKDHTLTLGQLSQKSGLSTEELNACLGSLRKKAAILITKEKNELVVKPLPPASKLREKGFLEEKLLHKTFPLEADSLLPEEKYALDMLKDRKGILKIELKKSRQAELTALGKELIRQGVQMGNVIDRLTPQMLRDESWKGKSFRHYDVSINVPQITGAKKQLYRRYLDDVRSKFLSLGFMEMSGPLVETDFWDMDALFMPQFHSARDIHSAYYIKEPSYGEVDNALLKKVKAAHENGFATGSKGWQYSFDSKQTRRLLLRTQGTALSARMLASESLKIPGKYFAIARCFRPDVVDATHAVDFNQVEGIVVEEGLDFRHLKGLLQLFAEEFAETDQIKITPAYFPFTEPSAELHAKHPELGWIELGGSGIFRPELVKPLLGKHMSVLAWGIGIDRLAMFKLGLNDIRQLFSQDLNLLREAKVL